MTSPGSPATALLDRIQGLLPTPVAGVLERAREEDVLLYSAALAFYALVSVAPFVIAAMWVTSLFMGDHEVKEAARTLGRLAPAGLGADKALVRVASLGTSLGITAVAAALWPASAYGGGLMRAFDRLTVSRKEREMRGLRGRGLALVALLPLFIAGGIGGSYLGASILDEGALRYLGYGLALVGGFAGTVGACAAIYRIFPVAPPGPRGILWGAGVAAVGISVLSLLFTIYLNVGADFGKRYAASGLAGVVLLGVWLYLANVMLLAGFQVAEEAGR